LARGKHGGHWWGMLCHGLLVFSDAINHWEKLLYLEGSLYLYISILYLIFCFLGVNFCIVMTQKKTNAHQCFFFMNFFHLPKFLEIIFYWFSLFFQKIAKIEEKSKKLPMFLHNIVQASSYVIKGF
jgi:hypothetical protein